MAEDDGKRGVTLLADLPEDEPTLHRYRAALYSAAYHSNADSWHRGAPYTFKPMSLDQLTRVFEERPHRVLQEHAAAWLMDGSARDAGYEPYIDRLVGRDAREEALGRISTDSIQPMTIDWGAETQDAAWFGPTRYASARESFWRWRRENEPPPPAPETPPAAPLGGPGSGPAGAVFGRNSVGAGGPPSPRKFSCRVRFDPRLQVTEVRASVIVDRRPEEFNVIADPQNWSTAAGLFFQKSALAQIRNGAIETVNTYAPPGARDYDSPLEEVVSLSFNPLFPLLGRNVLNVNYRVPNAQGTCRSDVNLRVCVSTTIGGSSESGGLDVDSGSFCAEGTQEGTRLTGIKRARFTDRELCGWELGPWLNLFAPLWIGPWLGVLVFESAFAEAPDQPQPV